MSNDSDDRASTTVAVAHVEAVVEVVEVADPAAVVEHHPLGARSSRR